MLYEPLIDDLPELYAGFLPEIFQQEIPEESIATCDQCIMACRMGKRKKDPTAKTYAPDLKCCTYFPGLPNYLVGGLLHNTDPALDEGRRRVREIIHSRVGVTPLMILPPKKYLLLYKASRSHEGGEAFGNSQSLLCPYFHRENRNCTIWKYRDAVCSTHFCKTVAGEAGRTFWDSVRTYLTHVQNSLCLHCVLQMNFDVDALQAHGAYPSNGSSEMVLTAEDLDDLPPKDYPTLWNQWQGSEEDFYKACYELISALTLETFEAITGVQQKRYLNTLRKNRDAVMNLPERDMIRLKIHEKGTLETIRELWNEA